MVNVKVPSVVGVPLISPDSLSSESPSGREPVLTDQVKGGGSPLVADTVALYSMSTVPSGSVAVKMLGGSGGGPSGGAVPPESPPQPARPASRRNTIPAIHFRQQTQRFLPP